MVTAAIHSMIRPARRDDCATIAQLFLLSSDGLAAYIWGKGDAPGDSLVAVGAARYAREEVPFSYRNCWLAEVDGVPVGMVHCFPMTEPTADEAEAEIDPVLHPYSELEDYGSLYVSGVAVFPPYRRAGLGTCLLATAERHARDLALPRLSLICFEGNQDALRLYHRLGYAEADRRALVPHPLLHYTEGDAILLAKPVRPLHDGEPRQKETSEVG